jgi:hypothetical protein
LTDAAGRLAAFRATKKKAKSDLNSDNNRDSGSEKTPKSAGAD